MILRGGSALPRIIPSLRPLKIRSVVSPSDLLLILHTPNLFSGLSVPVFGQSVA